MLRGRIRSRWVKRLLRNRSACVAAAFLLLLILTACFAPSLAPKDPLEQDLSSSLVRPSTDHLLGTDTFGRDTLSRLVVGSRVTLVAAVEGLAIAFVLGVPLGLLGGYVGGVVSMVLSRLADVIL